jgi:hypothetical protein
MIIRYIYMILIATFSLTHRQVKVKSVSVHAMEAYWGMNVYLHSFITYALDERYRIFSLPNRFIPRERAWVTH